MACAIHIVADVQAVLGEGPQWVPAEAALLWVDIKGRRLFRLGPAGLEIWTTPMQVGSIAPRALGGYVAATEQGFHLVQLTGAEASFIPLLDPETHLPDNRFNDGKVDRAGRFWAGTMDDTERAERGSLYRLDPDHRCTRVESGYLVTNGPAFSSSGELIYHTDSARRTIYRLALDPEGGIGEREIFARFAEDEGYPDGMTVDTDGCLWVACWDGWAVRRFSPDGDRLAAIRMPVQRPTSVAFGGADLNRLYVTSARVGLDPAALAMQPSAGALLMFEPGARGIAERPFEG